MCGDVYVFGVCFVRASKGWVGWVGGMYGVYIGPTGCKGTTFVGGGVWG